jgi:hypothetical protein
MLMLHGRPTLNRMRNILHRNGSRQGEAAWSIAQDVQRLASCLLQANASPRTCRASSRILSSVHRRSTLPRVLDSRSTVAKT